MIKISKGPLLEKFANCFISEMDFDRDEAMTEVINWVSQYVNGPWSETQKPVIEATERERFESIKAYIKFRVENSVTERARNAA